ncbi:hypothetical protein [Streptomyces aureocirculatus]|uniref:hypothetical protein n=1 Tax=Streptomyces aureocirculatus TaxID=67275 RepID=UPI00069240CD|nr:hypothetical protein [Streptomyces aureocirculatus]
MTGEVLHWLQALLGSDTTPEELASRYERLGTARAVAHEVLQERIAQLLTDPLKVTVNGIATVDNSANLAALERRLDQIDSVTAPDDPPADAPATVSVIAMHARPRR